MVTRQDPRRLLLFAAVAMMAVFIPYYVVTLDLGHPIPRDGTGLAIGRDFLNFWLYGRAALTPDPARFYDLPTYWAAIEAVAGPGYPGQQWSYPPTLMLLAAPFGALPYGIALAIWSAAGLGLFVAALRLWTRDIRTIAICVLAPAGVFGVISGQLAWVSAAAILAALRWREARPIAAGVLIGLLTIKPQIGILFPVLLLATGNWRAIGAAILTAVAIVAVTAAIWGLAPFEAWLHGGIGHQAGVLTETRLIVAPFMPTIFMTLRVAGAGVDVAYAIQAVVSVVAVAAVALAFRHRPHPQDRVANALFLAAGFVATPYLMAYDALALSVAAVMIAAEARRSRLAILVYLLPLINMAAANNGVPGAALIPLVWMAWLWREGLGKAVSPFRQSDAP